MTARVISGTFAQVLADMMQAPRGITVKQWIEHTRRTSGKQGG